jgi:MOSC domain-containing protein YiiM
VGTLLAVNVAVPREIKRRGRPVRTGIWKFPVEGRVRVRGVNVEGDEQADRSVHGGPDKAVYAYAREDYDWWEGELGRVMDPGAFGENLTVAGIDVSGAEVGERWHVGGVLLEVSEPRLPCWKLGVKMDDPRFLKRFSKALRPGAYLRIVEEGELGAGDPIDLVERPGHGITMELLARAYLADHELAPEILAAPALSDGWREWAQKAATHVA